MKTFATLAIHGSWQDRHGLEPGNGNPLTHVQRLYDAMPEPKLELEGVGRHYGVTGKVIGGGFGVGVDDRVKRAIHWLQGHEFDRLMVIAYSRGAKVAGGIMRAMDKALHRRWWEGEREARWARIDCLVLIDPVLSMGIDAAIKWATGSYRQGEVGLNSTGSGGASCRVGALLWLGSIRPRSAGRPTSRCSCACARIPPSGAGGWPPAITPTSEVTGRTSRPRSTRARGCGPGSRRSPLP